MPERQEVRRIIFNEFAKSQREGEAYVLPPEVQKVRDKGRGAIVGVFPSGLARSPMLIGVFMAMTDNGILPDFLIGTSAGSIGALAASKGVTYKSLIYIKEEGETVGWGDLARVHLKNRGFVTFDPMTDYMNAKSQQFNRLNANSPFGDIPLAIVATDVTRTYHDRGRLTLFVSSSRDNLLGKYIQASCAMPVVVSPVRIGGRLYADGGFNPMGYEPIDVARELFPQALIVSCRLTSREDRINKHSPDVRIWLKNGRRNKFPSYTQFDSRDVRYGYEVASGQVDEILCLMEERGIEQKFIQGGKPGVFKDCFC